MKPDWLIELEGILALEPYELTEYQVDVINARSPILTAEQRRKFKSKLRNQEAFLEEIANEDVSKKLQPDKKSDKKAEAKKKEPEVVADQPVLEQDEYLPDDLAKYDPDYKKI